jgi:predicted Zn finger-like uncharacterized protein
MRLTCPDCAAQYEVPETAIPAGGRDVQCAACGATWMQQRPEAAPAAEGPGPAEPDAVTPTPPPQAEPAQRRLDPEVADILRSEAARERAQRAAEATGDVGTAQATTPGDAAPAPPLQGAQRTTADSAAPTSRHAPLPDPGEINASLRPARDRAARDTDDAPRATPVPAGRSGFAAGFWVALVALGLAVAVYVAAPQLIARMPDAEAPITQYVAAVDSARLRLDALIDLVIARIRGG